MKIYTSYFAKMKKIPEDIVRISICGKAPDWYDGIQYKKVAPKYDFFQEWKKNNDNCFYIKHFNSEVLDTLKAEEVYKDLEKLSGGKDCVLLCYEKSSDFCHRHLVGYWLAQKLGIDVKEYDYEYNEKESNWFYF